MHFLAFVHMHGRPDYIFNGLFGSYLVSSLNKPGWKFGAASLLYMSTYTYTSPEYTQGFDSLTPTTICKCIYASAAALCITEWSSNRTYKRVGILYYEERWEVKMIHLSPAMHFAGWYICFCLRLLEMRIFCVGDASTVYEANRGMPLSFCISLLDAVLICMYRRKRAVLSAVRADLVQLHSIPARLQ